MTALRVAFIKSIWGLNLIKSIVRFEVLREFSNIFVSGTCQGHVVYQYFIGLDWWGVLLFWSAVGTAHQSGSANIDIECGHCVMCKSATYQIYWLTWRTCSHLSAQAHFQFQKCHFCNNWASPKQCVKVGFNRALKLVRGSQSQTLIGGGSYCFGLQWGLRCLVRIELNMAENGKGVWLNMAERDMAEHGDDRRSWTIFKR